MSENKKGKPKKSEQGSETERMTKRRIGKREREKEKRGRWSTRRRRLSV